MNIIKRTLGRIQKSFGNTGDKYSLYKSLDSVNFGRTSQTDFLNYNEISMYVNRAIEIRAEKVGCVEFKLKKGDKFVDRDKILDLINRPNAFHTGKQFWKLYQKYMDLTGNAFIFVEKPNELFATKTVPTALHLLRPDLVKIIFNKEGTEILGYEYTYDGRTTVYKADQILYSFNPDPKSPLQGMSLLRAGIRAIETEIQLGEYQAKVLKNGGRIEGVLNFKASLNKQQMKDLKESYEEEYAGAQKAGRPLFLGGDANYVNVGLNPAELAYLESKKVTLDDICILTGVPKEILGVTAGSTYANSESSIAIFLREIIKPILVDLTNFLDWRLISDEFELSFVDPTPEDIDTAIKKAKAISETHCGSINEMREILGQVKLPDEGTDDILIPFNLTKLDSLSYEIEKPQEKKKGMNHPLKDPIFRKKYGVNKAKKMESREKQFKSLIVSYFKDQEERILSYLPKKNFKKVMTKTFVDELFNPETEIMLASKTVIPLLRQIMIEAGKETVEMMNYEYQFTYTSSIETWLGNRAHLFAQEITDTTYKRLKNQFSESFENNETREQLVDRIENTYKNFTETRAKTIARTEVHGVTEKAIYEGYKQSGAKIKIWVAVMDGETRDSHASLDGEEVPIDAYFSNGLFMPGDVNAPAEEVINCRCQI